MPSADEKRFFKKNTAALRQLIPFLLLGIVVPAGLWLLNLIDRAWLIYGPITWFLALGIKSLPVFIELMFPLLRIEIKNIYLLTAWEGILSSLAELGLTIAFFLYFETGLGLNRVISFGLGIGFIEILFIAYLILEDIDLVTKQLDQLKTKKFILGFQLLERMMALAAHLFLRGIIGIAILYDKSFFYILFAFIVFAIVDGWGGYVARKMDLDNVNHQKKVYLELAGILVLPTMVFFYLLLSV